MPTVNSFAGPALRWVLLGASTAACLAVVVWWGPDPGPGAGTDPEVRRGEELDDLLRRSLRCINEKHRLAVAVAEGRLTLPGAAARFRDLNRENPGFNWERFRAAYPAASDDERCCRQVVAYIREEVDDH